MGLRELLEHEAGLAHSAEREPTSGLEYLQDVYKGRRVSDPARVRAAALALLFLEYDGSNSFRQPKEKAPAGGSVGPSKVQQSFRSFRIQ
jgi:hypothetical protein